MDPEQKLIKKIVTVNCDCCVVMCSPFAIAGKDGKYKSIDKYPSEEVSKISMIMNKEALLCFIFYFLSIDNGITV